MQRCNHPVGQFQHLWGHVDRHLFIREINRHFQQSHRPQKVGAPVFYKIAQGPGEHAKRLHPLRLGLGIQQIGKPLDLRQVHPVVLQRATGELSRFRQSRQTRRLNRCKNRLDRRRAAMGLEFDDILASEAVRGRKADHKRIVQMPACPVPQDAQPRGPDGGQRAGQGLPDPGRLIT